MKERQLTLAIILKLYIRYNENKWVEKVSESAGV